jgi:hypothetical protein
LCVFVAAGLAASTAVACQPPRTQAAPEIAETIATAHAFDIAETAVEYERTPKPKSKAPETETAVFLVFKLVAKAAVAGLSEVVLRVVMSFIVATPFKKCLRVTAMPEVRATAQRVLRGTHPLVKLFLRLCDEVSIFPAHRHCVHLPICAHLDPKSTESSKAARSNCPALKKNPIASAQLITNVSARVRS